MYSPIPLSPNQHLQFWSDLVMQHLETTHLFIIKPPECVPLLDSSTPRAAEGTIFFPVPRHLRSTQTQGSWESVSNMHALRRQAQSWDRELTSVQILRGLLMQPKPASNRSYGEAPGLTLAQTSWWFSCHTGLFFYDSGWSCGNRERKQNLLGCGRTSSVLAISGWLELIALSFSQLHSFSFFCDKDTRGVFGLTFGFGFCPLKAKS
jgi:hypothetical protein